MPPNLLDIIISQSLRIKEILYELRQVTSDYSHDDKWKKILGFDEYESNSS